MWPSFFAMRTATGCHHCSISESKIKPVALKTMPVCIPITTGSSPLVLPAQRRQAAGKDHPGTAAGGERTKEPAELPGTAPKRRATTRSTNTAVRNNN